MKLESTIAAVTVYKDRALIKRFAKAEFTEGEQKIVFIGLPNDIDTNSVQVYGGANSILQDLKINDVYIEQPTDIQIDKLTREIEEHEDTLEEINEKIRNASESRNFLVKAAAASTDGKKESLQTLWTPEKMDEMLGFYNSKLNTIDEEIRGQKIEVRKINRKLAILKEQLQKFNTRNVNIEKQVELKIFVREPAEIELVLSYIIMNAGWQPVYDLRLDSNKKKLTVAYNAIVSQRTSEKWDNVKLSLSTARPHVSGTSPDLTPWYLNIFSEVQYEAPRMRRQLSMKSTVPLAAAAAPCVVADEAPPMMAPEAAVETGATSVEFVIPGSTTILNDSDEHKVGITSLEFDAELEYSSVPKLNPFAYLKSIAINTSEYPFLAGKTNIFLDNNFVTHSSMGLIAPNEKFDCSLGIDEGITIQHKLIKKLTKDEGVFSKKNRILFEYKIIIKNKKKSSYFITVKDQIPISQNAEIKVDLLEPKIKENADTPKKNDDGSIEWILKLGEGETCELDLKFAVEYPKEYRITGM
jgi:uncharacterized protein (TIGR02231 family)